MQSFKRQLAVVSWDEAENARHIHFWFLGEICSAYWSALCSAYLYNITATFKIVRRENYATITEETSFCSNIIYNNSSALFLFCLVDRYVCFRLDDSHKFFSNLLLSYKIIRNTCGWKIYQIHPLIING